MLSKRLREENDSKTAKKEGADAEVALTFINNNHRKITLI